MPKLAFGTTLTWDGEVITGLENIGGVDASREEVDSTTHASPDNMTEALAGMITVGDVAISGFFEVTDTAGQHAMLVDFWAGTTKTGIITAPTVVGQTWTFTAWIKQIKIGDYPIKGNIPFTATLKIVTKPVFAVAAAAGMSALTISNSAVVSPTFAIGTFDYVATVLTAVASVIFTPTSAAGTITITANGLSQTVLTTQASSAIALGAAGSITTVLVVISEANKAPKTYTVRVVRGV